MSNSRVCNFFDGKIEMLGNVFENNLVKYFKFV